jgi:hypothetical protein
MRRAFNAIDALICWRQPVRPLVAGRIIWTTASQGSYASTWRDGNKDGSEMGMDPKQKSRLR